MAKTSLYKENEYEPYYKILGSKSEKNEDQLFSTMKDVYMLALVIGFKNKKRKKIMKPSKDPIKLIYFDEYDKVIMDIVALYTYINDEDISILRSDKQDEKYKLIEEYANAGMEVIVNKVCKNGYRLEDLVKFARSFNIDIDEGQSAIDILFGI
ncbi:MAG: hypothetical protein SOT71_12330 [Romboutsia timonensis]|uniref:hypothetical protein n=1 Tax=Romboutsia timonensis TaxID=1776391 RepID=UPI002A74BBA7|nr:hypothetical protein [Romboutsia timonensis]MDY2883428.1 hypothetical protein [Romboutsia timonensis]